MENVMSTKFALDFDKDVAPPKMGFRRTNPVRALIKQALEQLTLDHSYHIPATDNVPEPYKFYGHTVVAENSKWVKHAMEGGKGELKHFTIRPVGADDKRGVGARLYRVANITKVDAERRALISAGAAETREANKAKKAALKAETDRWAVEPKAVGESTSTETVREETFA
jgi:hypothetical protein